MNMFEDLINEAEIIDKRTNQSIHPIEGSPAHNGSPPALGPISSEDESE